jgi:hypothetical protein
MSHFRKTNSAEQKRETFTIHYFLCAFGERNRQLTFAFLPFFHPLYCSIATRNEIKNYNNCVFVRGIIKRKFINRSEVLEKCQPPQCFFVRLYLNSASELTFSTLYMIQEFNINMRKQLYLK